MFAHPGPPATDEAIEQLPPDDPFFDYFKTNWESGGSSLRECLSSWARKSSKPTIYLNKDGSLNMIKLMEGFTQHFCEHAPRWFERFAYKESGPHLLLFTYLTRIINGGGSIIPEFALGSNSVDLYITYKKQRIIVECKLMRGPRTVEHGLKQVAGYMKRAGRPRAFGSFRS